MGLEDVVVAGAATEAAVSRRAFSHSTEAVAAAAVAEAETCPRLCRRR